MSERAGHPEPVPGSLPPDDLLRADPDVGMTGRMGEAGVELPPDKTRIVYCKDPRRRGGQAHTSFSFLGYRLPARPERRRDGKKFISFLPTMGPEVLEAKGADTGSMRVHRRAALSHSAHPPGRRRCARARVVSAWARPNGRSRCSASRPDPAMRPGPSVRYAGRRTTSRRG